MTERRGISRSVACVAGLDGHCRELNIEICGLSGCLQGMEIGMPPQRYEGAEITRKSLGLGNFEG